MTVLGIETATTICAAAIAREGKILAEATLDEEYVHAEKLLTLVESVLRRSGCRLQELDGVAVSIGPGSFTGLRIGLSVAKGLVYATGISLVAVPTLQALAQRVVDGHALIGTEQILAALDARRDEVYCQFFAVEGPRAVPLRDAQDVSVSEMTGEISGTPLVVTGDGAKKLAQILGPGTSVRFIPQDLAECRAGAVALIGEELLAAGKTEDPATLEPRYIKEFFFRTLTTK